ncbi:MAG: hypothetical protein MI745_02785, partial [Pseudomonadales bacterium]|nr:hypothetical protein [Pseudomonadales bacterium]
MLIPNKIHFIQMAPYLQEREATTIVQWAINMRYHDVHLWIENEQFHTQQVMCGMKKEGTGVAVDRADTSLISTLIEAIRTECGHLTTIATLHDRLDTFSVQVGVITEEIGVVRIILVSVSQLRKMSLARMFEDELGTYLSFNAAENILALNILNNNGGIYLHKTAVPLNYAIPRTMNPSSSILFRTVNRMPYIFSNLLIASSVDGPDMKSLLETYEKTYLGAYGEFEPEYRHGPTSILRSDFGFDLGEDFGSLQNKILGGRYSAKETAKMQKRVDNMLLTRFRYYGLTQVINNWAASKRLDLTPLPTQREKPSLIETFTRSFSINRSRPRQLREDDFTSSFKKVFKRKGGAGIHRDNCFLMQYSFEDVT